MVVFKQIPAELDAFTGDIVLCVVGEDEKPLRASNAWIDWRLFGTLSELLVRGLFQGKLGEKCLLPTYGKFKFDRLILVGGGNLFDDTAYPVSEGGTQRWAEIGEILAKTAGSLKVQTIGLSLPRYDLVDQEQALVKALQASHLPSMTSLFISRAASSSSAIVV